MAIRYPTTAAQLLSVLNTGAVGDFPRAGNGDTVILAAGTTYATGATALTPQAGVTIEGLNRVTSKITGQFAGNLAGSGNPLTMRDFTVDSTGLDAATIYGPNEFRDGIMRFYGLRFTGAAAAGQGNQITFLMAAAQVDALLQNCEIDNAEADCISTKATGTPTTSILRVASCRVHDCGSGSADNWITCHDGFAVEVSDCHCYSHGYTGGLARGIQPENASTRLDVFDSLIEGARVSCRRAEGLNIITQAKANAQGISLGTDGGWAKNCRVVSPSADGNDGVYFANDNQSAINCYFEGFQGAAQTGVFILNTTGGTHNVLNCRTVNCGRGFDIRAAAGATVNFHGCITDNLCDSWDVLGAAGVTYNTGGNITGNGGSGWLVVSPDATDKESTVAQLDAAGIQRPGGNCWIGRGVAVAGRAKLGAGDLRGLPRLRIGGEPVGPGWPQHDDERNILVPLVQMAAEMVW